MFFFFYNTNKKYFECLNLTIFIIIPGLKFILLFITNFCLGIIIILNKFNCICCDDCEKITKDEKIKEFLSYDKFLEKFDNNESMESYQELEPIRLLMYENELDDNERPKKSKCFKSKIIWCIYAIIFVIVGFCINLLKSWGVFGYLVIFFILFFPISIAVPHPLFYCNYCKKCCNVLKDKNCPLNKLTENVEQKFKGLKNWIIGIIVLIAIFIIYFILFSFKIDDLENETIENSLGEEEKFNNTFIEDFTEQKFSSNYVKSPMCYTYINHLNFIQLVSLAQAAYVTKSGNIQKIKDIYYKNTIYKDSDIELINMEFITEKKESVVILKSDFSIPNSDKNVTVFSIRGSVTNKDWWLDLEMFSPSAIYSLIKMIPFLQNSETVTSHFINSILTWPLNWMEDVTLLKHYSNNIIKRIEKIIEKNNNTEFLFVGHSLGGGLSKYIATYFKKQSFSVSGPGITPLEYKFKEINGYNEYFKSNFIDIIPDNDIVPRFEISGGIKYRILCDKDPLKCHSIGRTLCMIGIMCRQEEYTKKLCLSMLNIGVDEYKEMKELYNGDYYCNNKKIKKDEKNRCKSGKVSYVQQKCCYVQLNYFKDNNKIEESKCIEFSNDNDIREYNKEFTNKYDSQPIIDCDL